MYIEEFYYHTKAHGRVRVSKDTHVIIRSRLLDEGILSTPMTKLNPKYLKLKTIQRSIVLLEYLRTYNIPKDLVPSTMYEDYLDTQYAPCYLLTSVCGKLDETQQGFINTVKADIEYKEVNRYRDEIREKNALGKYDNCPTAKSFSVRSSPKTRKSADRHDASSLKERVNVVDGLPRSCLGKELSLLDKGDLFNIGGTEFTGTYLREVRVRLRQDGKLATPMYKPDYVKLGVVEKAVVFLDMLTQDNVEELLGHIKDRSKIHSMLRSMLYSAKASSYFLSVKMCDDTTVTRQKAADRLKPFVDAMMLHNNCTRQADEPTPINKVDLARNYNGINKYSVLLNRTTFIIADVMHSSSDLVWIRDNLNRAGKLATPIHKSDYVDLHLVEKAVVFLNMLTTSSIADLLSCVNDTKPAKLLLKEKLYSDKASSYFLSAVMTDGTCASTQGLIDSLKPFVEAMMIRSDNTPKVDDYPCGIPNFPKYTEVVRESGLKRLLRGHEEQHRLTIDKSKEIVERIKADNEVDSISDEVQDASDRLRNLWMKEILEANLRGTPKLSALLKGVKVHKAIKESIGNSTYSTNYIDACTAMRQFNSYRSLVMEGLGGTEDRCTEPKRENTIFKQSKEPSVLESTKGDVWINAATYPILEYSFDGMLWVRIEDKVRQPTNSSVDSTTSQQHNITKESNMKANQILVALAQNECTTVDITFDTNYAPGYARTYTYKVSKVTAKTLEKGDNVVVETEQGYKVVTVVDVHTESQLDAEATYEYKWIVQKVDLADYLDHKNQDEARVTAIKADLRRQRLNKSSEAARELLTEEGAKDIIRL